MKNTEKIEKICKDNNIPFEKHWRVLPTATEYIVILVASFVINVVILTPKVTDFIIFPPIVFVISILLRIITKPKGYKLSWT